MNWVHSPLPNTSAGPRRSLESRTATWPSTGATSTHAVEFGPQRTAFLHFAPSRVIFRMYFTFPFERTTTCPRIVCNLLTR